ncbi:hypothetical protein [Vannielia litorea]|uniref:DUF1311 domain-containing protein n=1 Tax=Vannielia litorea TaxID=1217970 RepID=A0A1N6GXN8_9RHOB|nr:hypothetical protein [Vannielia litorea]SIO12299.1 hypothetical protein SAMN05444002_2885 [Vannielia litorea]
MTFRAALLALALAASPASAQSPEVDLEAIVACVQNAAGGSAAARCIEASLTPCDSVQYETPAVALLCYQTARATFDEGITAERQRLAALDKPVDAGFVTVNARYDMLGALLECDRDEDISLLGDHQPQDVARAKARCLTSVSAVTWLKLRLALRE